MKHKLPILWQRTPRGLLERLLPVDIEFEERLEMEKRKTAPPMKTRIPEDELARSVCDQGPLEIKMTEYRQKLYYYPETVIVPPDVAESGAATLAGQAGKVTVTHYRDKKQIRKRRKAQRKARRIARRLQKQRA